MTITSTEDSPQYYLDRLLECIEKYARQEITQKEYCNAWADYWRYYIGVNVIPAIGILKIPKVKWEQYQNAPISEAQHEQWKKQGMFDEAMAIISGRIWHRPDLENYYIVGFDADNIIAKREFLNLNGNGKALTIEQFASKTLVEQHLDNQDKFHWYAYTIGPQLRDKTSDIGKPNMDVNTKPAFEIKASSKFLMYCSPSRHKNGHRYQIRGTMTPFTLLDNAPIELQERINGICERYGLNKGENDTNKIPMRDLFKSDTVIYEGHNRHLALMRTMESLLLRNRDVLSLDLIIEFSQRWNEIHCRPPLDDTEFEKQWKCAIEFIERVTGERIGDRGDEAETTKNEISKITSEDLDFVFEVLKTEAEYDLISIKQLFYGFCSAFTKYLIHHCVNSMRAGAGKSYLLVLVSTYFPDKYVFSFIGMSNKAMLHEEGELVIIDNETGTTIPVEPLINGLELEIEELEDQIYDLKTNKEKHEVRKEIKKHKSEIGKLCKNAQKLILLDNKIILLLDTAQDGFYEIMMSMLSQDTPKDQIYQFTDKQTSGKLGAAKNRLRGTPAISTTQVVDDTRNVRHQEKNRRFIHVTPNTTKSKVHAAKSLIGKKTGMIPEEYNMRVLSKDKKEIVKDIVAAIVEKLIDHSKLLNPGETGVKVAFTESINHGLGGDEREWSMTVMDRTIRYLSVITKVRMDFRPRIVNTENGAFYPISTFEDLQETLQFMALASSTVRSYIANWYNEVFLIGFKDLKGVSNVRFSDSGAIIEREKYVGLTTDQLVYWTDKIKNISIGTDDVRKQYLYPLANLGIINIVKSTINGNEILAFPVDSKAPLSAIFTDENDLRLKIDDPALYPTKNILEEEFRTFIEHDAKEGGKNNEKFLILDPDGNELTVNELVDRYLSNPEICFIQNYTTPATQDQIAVTNLNNHLYTQQLIKIFNKNTPPTWKPDNIVNYHLLDYLGIVIQQHLQVMNLDMVKEMIKTPFINDSSLRRLDAFSDRIDPWFLQIFIRKTWMLLLLPRLRLY